MRKIRKAKVRNIKNLSFELYMLEPASRRFKQLGDNPRIAEVFQYLCDKESIELMITSTKEGRPAMEGLIERIEERFPQSEDFDIGFNYRHRQILGSMIRYIMGHYQYWPGKAKVLKKGKYIKTAITFHK